MDEEGQAELDALQAILDHAALLAKPELVLDLLAFGLSGEAVIDRVFGIRLEAGRNTPGVSDGLRAEPRLSDPERSGGRSFTDSL